jgi:uncharacterized protein YndB with AHSA1/START domain
MNVAVRKEKAIMATWHTIPTFRSCVCRALWSAAWASLVLTAAPVRALPNDSQANPGRNVHMTMKQDLAARSKEINWPDGFDPEKADLFSHNELVIDAPCERVWQHIIDATRWPLWYPNSEDVRIIDDRPVLARDTLFRWTTFGWSVDSKVNEFVPYTRIGWYGSPSGTQPSFYHAWYLTPQDGGCLVVTDEVGIGKDAAHLRETDESLMHRGHDLWLATLKWVSEGK